MSKDVAMGHDAAVVAASLDGWDTFRVRTVWVCEKWSEEACEHVRRKLGVVGEVSSELLRKIIGAPDIAEEEIIGNLLLNEGIAEMWDLICTEGSPTAYSNANAQIGVGNSNTAAQATDTGLLGGSSLYKGMNGVYPTRTTQTMAFQSDFTSGEANFAWEEWSVRNGVTADKNMNRKVQSLGTKATGTWTMTASITLA